jgi:hypothetical protein
MNQTGRIVFAADTSMGDSIGLITFLWNPETPRLTVVNRVGRDDVFDFAFERGGNWITTINNFNDIAMVSNIRTTDGGTRTGAFLVTRNGLVIPIAVPGEVLSDGTICEEACHPNVNDKQVVAFIVRRPGDPIGAWSAFTWQAGVRQPIANIGSLLTNGQRIRSVYGVWVNNQNPTALLAVGVGANVDDPFLLVRHSAGQLIPVVVPGQDMPGGGKLRRIQDFGVSFPNDLGQHALLATLTDGRSAAYLLEPNGDLSLLLVSGTTTPRGVLDSIGYGEGLSTGIALNNKGQIVTTVQLDGGVDTVALFSFSP